MQNKRGGIFTLLLFAIVLIIVGFFWFIKNMQVDTNVNIDLSRKDINTSELNETTLNDAGQQCINDGHRYGVQEIEGALRGVCIDYEGNTCEEWSYYNNDCTLKQAETITIE